MKRVILVLSILVIVALLAGCSSTTPTSAPATSTAPKPAASTTAPATSAATPATKVITVKWGHYAAPTDVRYKDLNFLSNRVKELTNGGLELKIYPSEQLVKTNEELEAVMRGSIDMASLNPDYFVGKLPALYLYSEFICTSPGYLTEVLRQTADLLDPYLSKFQMKYISGVELQPVGVVTKSKLAKAPADVAGLKLRAAGNLSGVVKDWGASPASIPNPEVYMSLQQGVVDGALAGYGTMVTQKLWEVTDCASALSVCPGSLVTVMNMSTWNSLPDNYKRAIQQAASESYDLGKKNAQDFVDSFLKNDFTKFKQTYAVAPGSAEADKWWGPSTGKSAAIAIKELGDPAQKWWDKIKQIVDGLKAKK